MLAAGDVNVIALDWTAGSSILYPVAMANVLASGKQVLKQYLSKKTDLVRQIDFQ